MWRMSSSLMSRLSMALAVFLALSIASVKANEKELHVLNWNGWGTDQPFAVEAFKKATGVKVVHDYINSFPELFTKLRTNPGLYDIVVLNTAYTMQGVEEGLLEPIDPSKLKNFSDLIPEMRESDHLNKDSKLWGVPWIWGGTTVAYNTEAVSDPPTSVRVLWEPKFADRVCWRDSSEDSVGFAALALGQNPDHPEDLNAVREKLKQLKPQIRAFWKSEDEWLKLVAANECDLSIIWTDSVEKATAIHKLPVTFIVPEEGALAWRDGLSIPKDPPNRDAAYAFIDYITGKEFYEGWTKAGGAPVTANTAALAELSAESLTRKVLADPKNVSRLNFKEPNTEEEKQQFLEVWEEAKSYYAE
jgi:spermidine/putrescine transport system substrate-binding protein